jgi:L-asparaginase/beta-aspartyl-peptidase (threonine type)
MYSDMILAIHFLKVLMMVIVTHGGAGSSLKIQDGCVKAAELGLNELRAGKKAIDAVLSAVTFLEDDGRFNAGSGSALGMDGKTISMDASIMDSCGILGAVAGLQKFKNPARIARHVGETPHWLLIGEGAAAFAKKCGASEHYHISTQARQHYMEIIAALKQKNFDDIPPKWQEFDIEKHWNYKTSWEQTVKEYGKGTVGAVAKDAHGNFAVCTSTGGSPPMLYGRVGDSPIIGCGFYAGKLGAIGATGVGEYIVKQTLTRTIYSWIESGMALKEALAKGISLFPNDVAVGLIGVTHNEAATESNREMAAHIISFN